jgi:AmpD protein
MTRALENPFRIGDDGWCDGAARVPSPNFDVRPPGTEIRLLVVHNISLPPCQFGGPYVTDLFTNRLDCDAHPYFAQLRGTHVSAHFLVRRDGAVIQFVSANDRAWHAGASSFRGQQRCNDFSVGIELEGSDFEPFEPVQYAALAALTCALLARYPLADVAGHEHIAPDRKTDPGPFFDWTRYRDMLDQPASASLGFPA